MISTQRNIKVAVANLLGLAEVQTPPVPVEKIARLKGAELRFKGVEGMSGVLIQEDGKVIIGVNALDPPTRQRFTIAHELGHLELHAGKEIHLDKLKLMRDGKSSQAVSRSEIEANAFAAELLMPQVFLKEDLKANAGVDYGDDDFLRKLAKRYDVSLQAMLFRLVNLGFVNPEFINQAKR